MEEVAADETVTAREFDRVREYTNVFSKRPEAFHFADFAILRRCGQDTRCLRCTLSVLSIQPGDGEVDQNVFAVCQSVRGTARDFDVGVADAGFGQRGVGVGAGGENPDAEVGVVGLGRVQPELGLVDVGSAFKIVHKSPLDAAMPDGGAFLRRRRAGYVVKEGCVGWAVAERAGDPSPVGREVDPCEEREAELSVIETGGEFIRVHEDRACLGEAGAPMADCCLRRHALDEYQRRGLVDLRGER